MAGLAGVAVRSSKVRVRYVVGHIQLSSQLLEQARENEDAIRRHEARLLSDPEYARRWDESVDWDAIEEAYDELGR